jgi:hypothetical protein
MTVVVEHRAYRVLLTQHTAQGIFAPRYCSRKRTRPDATPAHAPHRKPEARPGAARASAPPSNPSCMATTPSGTPRAYAPRAAASQRTRVRSSRWSCRGARRRQPGPARAQARAPLIRAQAVCKHAGRPPPPHSARGGRAAVCSDLRRARSHACLYDMPGAAQHMAFQSPPGPCEAALAPARDGHAPARAPRPAARALRQGRERTMR